MKHMKAERQRGEDTPMNYDRNPSTTGMTLTQELKHKH